MTILSFCHSFLCRISILQWVRGADINCLQWDEYTKGIITEHAPLFLPMGLEQNKAPCTPPPFNVFEPSGILASKCNIAIFSLEIQRGNRLSVPH